jgi:exopolysaccharide biosynthesis protein
LPPSVPNTELGGTVSQVKPGGGTPIPTGGAVLVGRGNQGRTLAAEAPVGTAVAIRLILNPSWPGVVHAIGGGPVLVRNGKAVFRAREAFSSLSLGLRQARTGIGQRANGKLLLVVADGGRPGYSVGVSNYDLARALVRLGAVTGYALGSGTSSVLAVDGKLLSVPASRRLGERGLADALLLVYRAPKTRG